MRALALRAVQMLSVVMDSGDVLGKERHEELMLRAEAYVKDAMATVVETVHTSAKTRLLDEGAIQLSTVGWVVGEVTKAIDEEVRALSPEVADKLVARIAAIKLPEDKTLASFTRQAKDEAFL